MVKQSDVISNQLPFIFRRETKLAPNGQILEDKQMTVQGKNLVEVEKVFVKEWNQ